MAYVERALFDPIRSVAAAGIGAAYAVLGAALTNKTIAVCFKNTTDGDVFISQNGVDDHLLMPPNSYNVWDIRTNAPNQTDLEIGIGTQFYVKDGPSAPTTGTVYMETLTIRPL